MGYLSLDVDSNASFKVEADGDIEKVELRSVIVQSPQDGVVMRVLLSCAP